jgi:enoyl-CoA hydratase/carnithine racemase
LACDLIVAAQNARFMLSHARIGLSPDGGATWSLTRALPRQLVQRWIWLAEPITADELKACGLVALVAPAGQALELAMALAERLAAMAPNALRSGKTLVCGAFGQTLEQQLGAEREHFIRNLFHANGGEGLQAFFEKREPRFE